MKSREVDFGTAKFVGVSGSFGAGKDTGADHLADEHGFLHVSTGDLLREIARKNGLDAERSTLVRLGIELRAEYDSQGALVIKGMEKWQEEAEQYPGGLVVTGLRVVGEAQEVLDGAGTLLYVDAPLEVRYDRTVKRSRDGEALQALEQFAAGEAKEMNGDPTDPTRPHLKAIRAMAHYVLVNDYDSPEPFLADFDRVLGLQH